MQKQAHTVDVRIGVKVVDARGVESARAANDPVHLVVFLEQQIGEITSVLPGDSCDERFLHERRLALTLMGELRKPITGTHYSIISARLLRRGNHDARENCALRRDQIGDAFASEPKHLIKLRLSECCFLARSLHFNELAVLSRNQVKIDSDRFVLLVVKIDNGIAVEHAGAYSGNK